MSDIRSATMMRTPRRLVILASVGIVVGAAAGILVPAGLGWDFANFYDTGGRALNGQVANLYEPFTPVGTHAPQGTMQFWGTPLSAYVYVPLALLPPYPASVALKLLDTLAVAGALLLLFRWVRRRDGPDPTNQWELAAVFISLALLFQPFWTVYRVGGQTTPFVFLLLVLALIWHSRGEVTGSAAALVAVTILKPAFVLLPAWLLLTSGRRFAVRFLTIGLTSAAVSVLLAGWRVHRQFIGLMLNGLGVAKTWQYNSSLYVVFENLSSLRGFEGAGARLTITVLTATLKAAVALTLALQWWRARREGLGDAGRRELDFVLGLLFFLLFSQIIWEHYLAPLFIVIAHVWATRERFSRGALIVVGAVSLFALWQNLVFVQWVAALVRVDTAGRALALGLLKSAPLWLTLAFVWRYGREWRSSFRYGRAAA